MCNPRRGLSAKPALAIAVFFEKSQLPCKFLSCNPVTLDNDIERQQQLECDQPTAKYSNQEQQQGLDNQFTNVSVTEEEGQGGRCSGIIVKKIKKRARSESRGSLKVFASR
jgi:hypothetical protein